MPVGNVLIRNTRCDIEHDDTALAVDVVPITKSSKLLLSCSIPDIELDVAQVLNRVSKVALASGRFAYCGETERVNFNTQGRNILLLELSSQMALDECCLHFRLVTDQIPRHPATLAWKSPGTVAAASSSNS
jgi:hypothetical protein